MKPSIELSRKWVDCSTIGIVDSGQYTQQPDILILEVKMYSKDTKYHIVKDSALDVDDIVSKRKHWIINSNTLGITPASSHLLQFELGIFEIKSYALYSTPNTFQLLAGVKTYTPTVTLPSILVSGNRVFKVTKEGSIAKLDKDPLVTKTIPLYTIEEDRIFVPSLCQFEKEITTTKDCDYDKTAKNFALIESIDYLIGCNKIKEAFDCIQTLDVEDCGCLDVKFAYVDDNDCGCP